VACTLHLGFFLTPTCTLHYHHRFLTPPTSSRLGPYSPYPACTGLPTTSCYHLPPTYTYYRSHLHRTAYLPLGPYPHHTYHHLRVGLRISTATTTTCTCYHHLPHLPTTLVDLGLQICVLFKHINNDNVACVAIQRTCVQWQWPMCVSMCPSPVVSQPIPITNDRENDGTFHHHTPPHTHHTLPLPAHHTTTYHTHTTHTAHYTACLHHTPPHLLPHHTHHTTTPHIDSCLPACLPPPPPGPHHHRLPPHLPAYRTPTRTTTTLTFTEHSTAWAHRVCFSYHTTGWWVFPCTTTTGWAILGLPTYHYTYHHHNWDCPHFTTTPTTLGGISHLTTFSHTPHTFLPQ